MLIILYDITRAEWVNIFTQPQLRCQVCHSTLLYGKTPQNADYVFAIWQVNVTAVLEAGDVKVLCCEK